MLTRHGFITSKKRSGIMKKIKSKDTKPEIMLRRELWKRGYRYRKNFSELPGKPDIVFIKKKVVVFIDGDFWHGYNWEEKKKKILNNKEYWVKKIEKNIERDKENTKKLSNMGYKVIRFWEHEIKTNINKCVNEIIKTLKNI